jgi:uncharacterized phiE125 gp8 family phage protein
MSVDLTLAKAQCRVTNSASDTLLVQYIAAAKAYIERYTGLLVVEAEVVDIFTAFGDFLTLSRGPFVALTEIAYTDADSNPQTVSGALVLDGKIYPPAGGWPSVAANTPITVTYDAGYGGYNVVPDELVQAQLLLISHWYDNRGAVVVGQTGVPTELQYAIKDLAGPFRLPTLR